MSGEIDSARASRILFATIGSLGDLHPMLALGLEFKRRGHKVTVASTEYYRARVEALGIGFRPLRPDWNPTDQDLIAQCEDLRSGPEVLFRKLMLPHLRATYADLLEAVQDADLMVAGELVFAAPMVAQKLGLRWVSAILSPCSFFSAHDPSLLANLPEVYRLRRAGWAVNRAILELGRVASRHWWEPVRSLRREFSLPISCDPIFRDKFSPDLVLALFSSALAKPQRDWPRQTVQPGFVFFDGQSPEVDDAAIAKFLAAGDAPIVFTLGSTAVSNAGNFFEVGAAVARRSGRRAILIGGKPAGAADSGSILTVPYAPYSHVFPRAALIVHQGGSGTTGQALRAGRPQLIVPYGWDQPDNAARVQRIGVGRSLARNAFTVDSALAEIEVVLGDASFAAQAGMVGEQVQREEALVISCQKMELLL